MTAAQRARMERKRTDLLRAGYSLVRGTDPDRARIGDREVYLLTRALNSGDHASFPRRRRAQGREVRPEIRYMTAEWAQPAQAS